MKIEDQVVSLQSAKRLKELSVPQDSLWYWDGFNKPTLRSDLTALGLWMEEPLNSKDKWFYSAFTVAELGEMLPDKVVLFDCNYEIRTMREIPSAKINKTIFSCGLYPYAGMGCEHCKFEKTEAEARAKMLIHLIENKLIGKEVQHK